jgi:hypothetical protein
MSFDFNCSTFVRLGAAPSAWEGHANGKQVHLPQVKSAATQWMNGAISRTIS